MLYREAAERQKPGTDYGALKSLVATLAPERRSSASLNAEELTNFETYLRYKTIHPHERRAFQAPGFTLHRHGFIHLPALTGTAGIELDHTCMEGRLDEIADIIVKGDRIWCIFTLRARHVGPLYGRPATNKDLAIAEMCCLRYESGKLAETWFVGDELGICRQIGIAVQVPRTGATPTVAPTLTAGAMPDAENIAAYQAPGTDYGDLKSLVTRRAPETRRSADLTDEESANLACYLSFKAAPASERPSYWTATFTAHRRSMLHLPELRGMDLEFDRDALADRSEELEDVIVAGDRLWSVSTLRARHVGPLHGVAPTGRTIAMLEYGAMRFEQGKIAEAWTFGEELGLCRQLGIPIITEGGSL